MELFWLTEIEDVEGVVVPRLRISNVPNLAEHGLVYRKVDPYLWESVVRGLIESGEYIEHDVVEISPHTPNLQSLLTKFYQEHKHGDDEVRLIIAGTGFFEVRDRRNGHHGWFRIDVSPGDMLTIPAGRYHRFSTSPTNYIKAVRLFTVEGVWKSDLRQLEFSFGN